MAYSYDRTKTAAKLDVYDKWRDIVEKHDQEERKEMDALVKSLVNYFRSVGFDLDVSKSWLGKDYRGSDGHRLMGQFVITEREENTVKYAEYPKMDVRGWVEEATGLYGSPRKVGEKQTPRGIITTFVVELGE